MEKMISRLKAKLVSIKQVLAELDYQHRIASDLNFNVEAGIYLDKKYALKDFKYEIEEILAELLKISESKKYDEELHETIENALQSTGKFELEHCSELTEGIILMMKQEGFKITKN